MIYPNEIGSVKEELRLKTLESVWIQGKLKMWGRWSYIGEGKSGNMFNQLLSSKQITKTAIQEILKKLQKSGIDQDELKNYFAMLLTSKLKSGLSFCSDTEALMIDKVIGEQLAEHKALISLLHKHYDGKGRSIRKLAEEMCEHHPDLSFMTCRRRISTWLSFAETILYPAMYDIFRANSTFPALRNEPGLA
jgi:Protein of unknown function (DUF1133).